MSAREQRTALYKRLQSLIRNHSDSVGITRNHSDSVGITCDKNEVNSAVYKRPQSLIRNHIVQELCESRGGRPGLSVLTSLLVSVDVKIY